MSEAEFNKIADTIKAEGKGLNLSNDDLLILYGLFKQATMGDNSTSAPWAVQFEAKAKWDAWTKNKGKSAETARKEYITFANGLLSKKK